jgi:hypothetical protein
MIYKATTVATIKKSNPFAFLLITFLSLGCANQNGYGPYGYPQQYQAYPYPYGQPIQPSPTVGTPPPGMIPGQTPMPGGMPAGGIPGVPGAYPMGQPQYPQAGVPAMPPGGYFPPPGNANQPFFGR